MGVCVLARGCMRARVWCSCMYCMCVCLHAHMLACMFHAALVFCGILYSRSRLRHVDGSIAESLRSLSHWPGTLALWRNSLAVLFFRLAAPLFLSWWLLHGWFYSGLYRPVSLHGFCSKCPNCPQVPLAGPELSEEAPNCDSAHATGSLFVRHAIGLNVGIG